MQAQKIPLPSVVVSRQEGAEEMEVVTVPLLLMHKWRGLLGC